MLIVVLTIVVVISAAVLFVATRPSGVPIRRSTRINAAPDRIFPLINDLKQWQKWSPYEDIDPNLKRDYRGAGSGEGAAYAWEGNGKVGAGRMQITKATYPQKIDIALEFFRPFKGNNRAEFTLQPTGGQTEVTWTLIGGNSFMCKVMGLFMNMDKMIGGHHEKGLLRLKQVVEA
jgi:hypothetical protein